MLRATAPGKVVLAGEYAVVDGAPAIAMGVNRRASAALATVSALGDGRIANAVRQALGLDSLPSGLQLESGGFYAGTGTGGEGKKLGIGSSAALTAALARLLAPPHADETVVLDAALAAHAAFQGGTGSGVDVATCVAGGVVRFDPIARRPAPAAWPDGLHCRFWWSGTPASTGARLERLRAGRRGRSAIDLREAAVALSDCWIAADVPPLLASLGSFRDVLQAFSAEHDLDVFGAGHSLIAGIAKRHDVVYKPCGAGGGDIGVAFGDDPDALAAFAKAVEVTGFTPLDLRVDWQGARLEEGRE